MRLELSDKYDTLFVPLKMINPLFSKKHSEFLQKKKYMTSYYPHC